MITAKIHKPLRVLLIVDSLYWVKGNFAQHNKRNNPFIQAVVISRFALRKAIQRFGNLSSQFDVIHFVCNKSTNQIPGNIPKVTTLHHMDSHTDIQQFIESDAVMTVSSQWQNNLIRKGIPKENALLVPFAVDLNTFHPPQKGEREEIKKALGLETNTFVVGFSGKLSSDSDGRKGLDCFSQAIHTLHSQLPDLSVLMIGPGWHHHAKNLQLNGIPCIHLAYEFEHKKISKFYRVLDVFWVTSRIEGGPVTLLEAMATEIPCISTPVGIALDLLKDKENGFLVPFDDSQQFVGISLFLSQNKDVKRQIGRAARNTIMRERQWDQVHQKLLELYNVATRNFNARNTNNTSLNQNEQNSDGGTLKGAKSSNALAGIFSPKVLKWINACEHLIGFKMLLELSERKAAVQAAFRAIKSAPFDFHVWWTLTKMLRTSYHPL